MTYYVVCVCVCDRVKKKKLTRTCAHFGHVFRTEVGGTTKDILKAHFGHVAMS